MTKEQTIDLDDIRSRIQAAVDQLDATFVARTDSIRLIELALITGQNFLLIGDPGTAKTKLIECFYSHIKDASTFSVMCGSFTTLDELCGPTDIKAFQSGSWARVTTGMLPEADFAFLDEVMKTNDGAINSLLQIANERRFMGKQIPLWTMGAATNWPEVVQRSDKVEAMYDRFLLRAEVKTCKGDDHTKMLRAARTIDGYKPQDFFTKAELAAAREVVKQVNISETVEARLTDVVSRLDRESVVVSNRRSARMQLVLQASAWLRGSDEVALEDFDAVRFGFWVNQPDIIAVDSIVESLDQKTVQDCVKDIDNVRRDYQGLAGLDRDSRVKRAPAVLKNMKATAQAVKRRLKEEGATATGKEKIRAEMAKMRGEFEQLNAEIRREMGLDINESK